jgi:hypothetical protein
MYFSQRLRSFALNLFTRAKNSKGLIGPNQITLKNHFKSNLDKEEKDIQGVHFGTF